MKDHESTIPPEALLRHSDFVSRIARGLLVDEGLVQDVVQDTWLAALERPPAGRFEARAWLATVVRRLAFRRLRSGSARKHRERSVARPEGDSSEVPGDSRAAAFDDALRGVTEAVLSLREPYRTTVRLRYYEGLGPSEIAARLGVPVATVHSRIQRAHAQMKERLDSEYGGGRKAWCTGLFALLNPDSSLAAPTAVGASSVGVLEVLFMSVKLKVAVVTGLVGVGALTLWDSFQGEPVHPDLRVEAIPEVARLVVPENSVPEPEPPATERSAILVEASSDPVEITDDPETGALLLRATWEATGNVAAGSHFRSFQWDAPEPFRTRRSHVTDARGEFFADGLLPGTLLIYGDFGGGGRVTIEPGETVELDCVIPRGVAVTGQVVDADGAGVEGASIWVSDYGNTDNGRVAAHSGEDGQFALPSVPKGHSISATAPGHGPAYLEYVDGSPGETMELRLRLGRGAGELAGSLIGPSGDPVEGAAVRFVAALPVGTTGLPSYGEIAPYDSVSDANGAFEFVGLSCGTGSLMVDAEGCAPLEIDVVIEPGERAVRELQLTVPGVVMGRALDPDGEPLPRVEVRYGGYGKFNASYGKTGVDGRFRLGHLPLGPVSLQAELQGHGIAQQSFVLQPDQPERWDIQLDPGGRIAGRFVDSLGTPLEGLWVNVVSKHPVRPGSRTLWSESCDTDSDGRFVLSGLPDDRFEVSVYPKPFDTMIVYRATDVLPDGPELAVVLTSDDLPNAHIRGRVHGADGKPVSVRLKVSRRVRGGWPLELPSNPDGTFQFGPLVPGEYTLLADSPAGYFQRLQRFTVTPNEERDLGRIDLTATVPVDLQVAGYQGLGPYDEICFLPETPESGPPPLCRSSRTFDASEGDNIALLPGTYRVRAGGPDVALTNALFQVQPGSARLELAPVPGFDVSLRYRLADGAKAMFLKFDIRDDQGMGVQSWAFVVDARSGPVGSVSLAPGQYSVQTLSQGELRGERKFEVTGDAGFEQVLELVVE